MLTRLATLLLALTLGCESTPILLYHSVGEEVGSPRWVSSERFREQLEFLEAEGYTPITAAELDAIELDGAPAPAKPVVLTFDDGYENFYKYGFPLLREFGFPATVFLIAEHIGDSERTRVSDASSSYLIWPEIWAMRDWGVEFQSHSVTHPRLKGLAENEARSEILDSKRILEDRLDRPVTVFAYPYGSSGAQARELVELAGYLSAHSVGAGINGRFQRIRTSIHSTHDLESFAEVLGGSWWASSNGTR